MSQDHFAQACDRLSQAVDATLYERLRWERHEGPMLARLVALAHGALEARPEFELAEEGATSDIKRFVLKIHSMRTVAVTIWLDQGRAAIRADMIERSRFKLAAGEPIVVDYELVDERWMAHALQDLFSRVHT